MDKNNKKPKIENIILNKEYYQSIGYTNLIVIESIVKMSFTSIITDFIKKTDDDCIGEMCELCDFDDNDNYTNVPASLRGVTNVMGITYKDEYALLIHIFKTNKDKLNPFLLKYINQKRTKLVKYLIDDIGLKINGNHLCAIVKTQNSTLFKDVLKEDVLKEDIVNQLDDSGYPAVYYSISNNDIEMTKKLVKSGADIKMKFRDGQTLLYLATFLNNYDIAKYILKQINNDIDINAKLNNDKDETVLYLACRKGLKKFVDLFISYKPDFDIKCTKLLNTALNVASYTGSTSIVNILINNKANVNEENIYGQNAIYSACCCREVDNIEPILNLLCTQKNNPVINKITSNGYAAVHILAHVGDIDGLKVLKNYKHATNAVSNNADFNISDTNFQETPIFIAKLSKHSDIVYYLKDEVKVDVTKENKYGQTYEDIVVDNTFYQFICLIMSFLYIRENLKNRISTWRTRITGHKPDAAEYSICVDDRINKPCEKRKPIDTGLGFING